ncbi:MAG: type II toxin-antitoxin system ParD family antitoxin [Variovorax sp.]
MNISLPDELKAFVDLQLRTQGFGTSSEYMRELIRRDRERVQFRQYLLDGVSSKPAGRLDAAYFGKLRKQVKAAARRSGA